MTTNSTDGGGPAQSGAATPSDQPSPSRSSYYLPIGPWQREHEHKWQGVAAESRPQKPHATFVVTYIFQSCECGEVRRVEVP